LKVKYFSWFFIFLLLFISSYSCSRAFADGCFFGSQYRDVYSLRQRAFIKYFNHIEELVIQVAYQGEPQDFSWVVPLPGYPSIEEANARLFQELHDFTTPAYPRSFCGGIKYYAPTSGTQGVTVWETLTIGYYNVAVLSSQSGESLTGWLSENGYVFPDEGSDILDYYVQNGFYFAAFKMQPGTKDEGNLDPVLFTFSTPHPFYPMRLTALSTQGTDVLLYLYAESPLQPKDPGFYSLFERSVKSSDFSRFRYPELQKRCDHPGYLSKWEGFFTSEEMTNDIDLEVSRITFGGTMMSGTAQGLMIVLVFSFLWWKRKR